MLYKLIHIRLCTLVSRIEVSVRLFFFAFFPQPVCLIWVYMFNSLKKNELPVCLFGTCMVISDKERIENSTYSNEY